MFMYFVYFSSVLATVVTVFGRAGLVLLSVDVVMELWGVSQALAITLATLTTFFATISYLGLIGKPTAKLFVAQGNKIKNLCSSENNEEERLLNHEVLPIDNDDSREDERIAVRMGRLGIKLGAWVIGIATAVSESTATYVGWGTLLTVMQVPKTATLAICLTLGIGSFPGWMALAGYPTATIFVGFYDSIVNKLRGRVESENNIHYGYRILGGLLAVIAGAATGCLVFFAVKSGLSVTRYSETYVPSYVLSPIIVTSATALYYTILPSDLKALFNMVSYCKKMSLAPLNLAKEFFGLVTSVFSGGACYFLIASGANEVCDALDIQEPEDRALVVNSLAAPMAAIGTLVLGGRGYRLVKSPLSFFSEQPIAEIDEIEEESSSKKYDSVINSG